MACIYNAVLLFLMVLAQLLLNNMRNHKGSNIDSSNFTERYIKGKVEFN